MNELNSYFRPNKQLKISDPRAEHEMICNQVN